MAEAVSTDIPSALIARDVASILKGAGAERLRQQFADLVAAIPDAVLITDRDGVVHYVNAAARDLFGKSQDDLVGERIGFAVETGKVMEIDVLRGGAPRKAEVRIVECFWNRRDAYLALIRDVTESKRLNEQLRQARKMEAVGLHAGGGGIAHDFNNLLVVMMLHAGLLQENFAAVDYVSQELGEIVGAIERARDLTRQLLVFSRKQPAEMKAIDIAGVIAGFPPMLRRVLPSNIAIELESASRIWPVRADRGQIEQVVMNLAINARDAMPGGGRFTLSIRNARTGGLGFSVPPGDYVVLRVEDTGAGMEPGVIGRVFEPFFTTKARGGGTGLGLATSYGIIAQAGGSISAESGPGAGAVFTILLPRTQDEVARVDDKRRDTHVAPGHESILLVEDDQMVARAAGLTLENAGYRVTTARDGLEALAILEHAWASDTRGARTGGVGASDAGAGFDLVLSDVVMPRMGGPELAAAIAQDAPDLPIVFMTGYTGHVIVQDAGDMTIAGRPTLLKPFSQHDLLAILRATLDARKAG